MIGNQPETGVYLLLYSPGRGIVGGRDEADIFFEGPDGVNVAGGTQTAREFQLRQLTVDGGQYALPFGDGRLGSLDIILCDFAEEKEQEQSEQQYKMGDQAEIKAPGRQCTPDGKQGGADDQQQGQRNVHPCGEPFQAKPATAARHIIDGSEYVGGPEEDDGENQAGDNQIQVEEILLHAVLQEKKKGGDNQSEPAGQESVTEILVHDGSVLFDFHSAVRAEGAASGIASAARAFAFAQRSSAVRAEGRAGGDGSVATGADTAG